MLSNLASPRGTPAEPPDAAAQAHAAPPSIVVPDGATGGQESSARESAAPVAARQARRVGIGRRVFAGLVAVLLLATAVIVGRQRAWFGGSPPTPTFAVGFIQEEGIAGTLRATRVLTDMIATDLARVEGLAVLSNSRLMELMRPGQDSAAGYAEAARRAGATELLEGQIFAPRHDTVQLEIRRVELRTGIVKDVYRVRALDRYALVDSLTRAIANRFQLTSPASSIASATTKSLVAYRLYDEGLRAYFENDLKGAQRLMNAALAEDSSFALAAYWVVKIGKDVWDPVLRQDMSGLRPIALRLASHAPDRERLMISADLLSEDEEPRALAVAESLATRFHDDPRAFGVLGRVYGVTGDWSKAAGAVEHAIALDSAGERDGAPLCMLCEDFNQLATVYFWWDSLPAVVRTAQRFRALRPRHPSPYWMMGTAAQRLGDSATAYENWARLAAMNGTGPGYQIVLDLGLEAYDRAQQRLTPQLASSLPGDHESAEWWYLIALRNQGDSRSGAVISDGLLARPAAAGARGAGLA